MSRNGMLTVGKRKQIPRIFQRQKTTNNPSSWLTSLSSPEDGHGISTREQTESSHYDSLPSSSYQYQHAEVENNKKRKESGTSRSTTKEIPEKTWNAQSCQVICFVLFSFAFFDFQFPKL